MNDETLNKLKPYTAPLVTTLSELTDTDGKAGFNDPEISSGIGPS